LNLKHLNKKTPPLKRRVFFVWEIKIKTYICYSQSKKIHMKQQTQIALIKKDTAIQWDLPQGMTGEAFNAFKRKHKAEIEAFKFEAKNNETKIFEAWER